MAGSRRWSRKMLIFFSGGIERRLQRSELETTTRRRRSRKMLIFFQRGPRDRAQVCLLVTRTAAAIVWRFSASSLSVRSEIIFVEHGLAATHQQLFNDTLLKINMELAYLQFELRACMNQYDGKVYYGVVNNIVGEESKLGTKYSVPQIAFYKGLLEAIVQEAGNDGSITSIDALNVRLDNQVIIVDGSQESQSRLPTSIKNFSMSQKEKTLDELIRDRWLSYTSTGKIGLGTRSFLDLRSWFRGNDIPSCVVCNEACIKASSCPNEECNVRIHEYCLRKRFSQRKASRACPGCGTEWPRQDGDDDANEPEEGQAPSANRSSRKRRKRGVKAELVEEDDNAGPPAAVPRRRTSRSVKAEAARAAQEASSSAGASRATRTSKRRKR